MKKLLFVFFPVLFLSCKHDAIQSPPPVCDSSIVTYNNTIKIILQQKCYSCHSGATLSGGVDLGFYNNVKFYADEGSLWSVCSRNGQYPPMPLDAANKVDECQLGKINKWIREGALNN